MHVSALKSTGICVIYIIYIYIKHSGYCKFKKMKILRKRIGMLVL